MRSVQRSGGSTTWSSTEMISGVSMTATPSSVPVSRLEPDRAQPSTLVDQGNQSTCSPAPSPGREGPGEGVVQDVEGLGAARAPIVGDVRGEGVASRRAGVRDDVPGAAGGL